MREELLKTFIEKFNREKDELNRRFEDIDKKLDSIDQKFDSFDKRMDSIESSCKDIENLFEQLGDFSTKMEDVNIYLSQIETRLNQYKTLTMSGRKLHNGEIYVLKVKLQKVKPIIHWENDELLSSKFKQIEYKIEELEGSLKSIVV
ncbi:MAG: hypothetical protein N2484_00295 [Clostridia bacterium]|nr:hypothetical protein [Clostridia bacterium]